MIGKGGYIYIVSNKNRTVLYIGVTADLYNRISEHKESKGLIFAKKYNCIDLLYYEFHTIYTESISLKSLLIALAIILLLGIINMVIPNFFSQSSSLRLGAEKFSIFTSLTPVITFLLQGIFYADFALDNGKVVALFSGQGSQYVNMGKELACSFPEVMASFAQMTDNQELASKLQSVYSDVNNIDAWVGLLAEKKMNNTALGETLHLILKEQFENLMRSDRFYFWRDPVLPQAAKLKVLLMPYIKFTTVKAVKHTDIFLPCQLRAIALVLLTLWKATWAMYKVFTNLAAKQQTYLKTN